jgi:hypothetical protein
MPFWSFDLCKGSYYEDAAVTRTIAMIAKDIFKVLFGGKGNMNPSTILIKVSRLFLLLCYMKNLFLKIVSLIRGFMG